jgi:hypothetical protein
LVQWRITRLVLAAAQHRAARIGIFVFDAVVAIGYTFTFPTVLMRLPLPHQSGMVIGAVALAYFMTASAVMVLHAGVSFVQRHLNADTSPARRTVLNAAGNTILAAPFAVMGYGALVQRTDFRVRELDLPVNGLAPDLDGLRLLQLSDIHLSAFLSEGEFARVIDASRELRPHLAVVTGDLISGPNDPLDACIRQIARLRADSGVFGCMGNHERYARCEAYTAREAARHGIHFLRGEARTLRFGNAAINLVGTDFDPYRNRRHYLTGARELFVPGVTNILLQHNPDVFPVAAQQGYNLLLAGHTHGGQVTVEILEQSINPARFFTPYIYGLYRSGASTAYVTRGIGTIGVPARIGAPPEISLLRLRKA